MTEIFSEEIQKLLNEAQSDNVVYRIVAIRQLTYMETEESAQALLTILDDIHHLYIFRNVVVYLDKMGVLDALPYLQNILDIPISQKTVNLHVSALKTIRQFHERPETIDVLSDFIFKPLEHTRGHNRTTAAIQIGVIGSEKAFYILGHLLLTQNDLPVRRSAIQGLVKSLSPRAHDVMLHILDDLFWQRSTFNSDYFGLSSDVASGIYQLAIRNIFPKDKLSAAHVLLRWLYILPPTMSGNVLSALISLKVESIKPLLDEYQENESIEKTIDDIDIFK